MIDWYNVVVNSFWILGLAIILAAGSYHHWQARERDRSLRDQFNQPSCQLPLWLGFCFVCVGLAGSAGQTWETIVWVVFGLIGLYYGAQSGLELRRAGRSLEDNGN